MNCPICTKTKPIPNGFYVCDHEHSAVEIEAYYRDTLDHDLTQLIQSGDPCIHFYIEKLNAIEQKLNYLIEQQHTQNILRYERRVDAH